MGRVTASAASQSPPHRHILRRARTQVRAFFSHIAPAGGGEAPTGVRQLASASWTDDEPARNLPRQNCRKQF
ncbi:hypothetical protein EGY08_04155 [Klebsiella sp. FDAARGOS_511]|nr:hypothetical protein EGY08_04155 [Klebsiella sp. FDAARGOS_511]